MKNDQAEFLNIKAEGVCTLSAFCTLHSFITAPIKTHMANN